MRFSVETSRVLEILAKQIYDSPYALVRENVQNAYDAVRMRAVTEGKAFEAFRISIIVESRMLKIADNGIGMTMDVLENNFWKAGSSGKNNEAAQRAGVIGTFGIGAMANFGVCSALTVESRSVLGGPAHVARAERSKLAIGEDCIEYSSNPDGREPGTTIIADLDDRNSLTEDGVHQYLLPFVRFVPVPVFINDRLVSQDSPAKALGLAGPDAVLIDKFDAVEGGYGGHMALFKFPDNTVGCELSSVVIAGAKVYGQAWLRQSHSQIMGLRSGFGLAPIPLSGYFGLGGFLDLEVLQPTAGREALQRESIQHSQALIAVLERRISERLATTDIADGNPAFIQFVQSQGRIDLAGRVRIQVLPDDDSVELSKLPEVAGSRALSYYDGIDSTTLKTFASESACLAHCSQLSPRRQVQLRYLQEVLKIPQVPDTPQVRTVFAATDLRMSEALLLLKVRQTLSEDYLLPDVNVALAEISHQVTIFAEQSGSTIRLLIARSAPAIAAVVKSYESAPEVFGGFVKDFVRNHVYPRIADMVPSSTRLGVEALQSVLQRNRELYRLEVEDLGGLENLLTEYLAGKAQLGEVLAASQTHAQSHSQQVASENVGRVEDVLSDVAQSPTLPQQNVAAPFAPAPPIVREEVDTSLKVLTVQSPLPQLNEFQTFLALSDRAVRYEGEFFRWPHTTKVIWAGHRIIYVFSTSDQSVNLYYDIELRDSLGDGESSGGQFPTTTIITRNRIFIPVPQPLEGLFRVTEGVREFYVRFDTIP